MTKVQKAARDGSIAKLREWIKPGDTVYTILDHVSASGMSRAIRVVLPTIDRHDDESKPATVDFIHPNYAIGEVLGLRHWKRNGYDQDALVIGGCGMDMGFHLVYNLSSVLYGDGYKCLGKGKCPSNYHANHHDTVTCPGPVAYNPEGPNTGDVCHWVRGIGHTLDGKTLCHVCNGDGRIPNPEGPERFDLTHTDGYALRHRWM